MALPSKPSATADAAAWSAVQRFMLRSAGVVLREDQAYLIEPRLTPVAKQHGFVRLADFVSAACAAPAGSPFNAALIDAMTTHETLFFRDPNFWKLLEPVLTKCAIQRSLKVWSAACSTGQEPYSITMVLAERFPDLVERTEIIATDISEQAVQKAREGVYTALEVNRGLPATRLVKHFTQVAGGYRIKDNLRSRITWSVHNLLGGKPDPTRCDLVLCRNVLIYFGETDRAAVARRLFDAASPGGLVAVGATETLRDGEALGVGVYKKAG